MTIGKIKIVYYQGLAQQAWLCKIQHYDYDDWTRCKRHLFVSVSLYVCFVHVFIRYYKFYRAVAAYCVATVKSFVDSL